jgi:hypothetical protein
MTRTAMTTCLALAAVSVVAAVATVLAARVTGVDRVRSLQVVIDATDRAFEAAKRLPTPTSSVAYQPFDPISEISRRLPGIRRRAALELEKIHSRRAASPALVLVLLAAATVFVCLAVTDRWPRSARAPVPLPSTGTALRKSHTEGVGPRSARTRRRVAIGCIVAAAILILGTGADNIRRRWQIRAEILGFEAEIRASGSDSSGFTPLLRPEARRREAEQRRYREALSPFQGSAPTSDPSLQLALLRWRHSVPAWWLATTTGLVTLLLTVAVVARPRRHATTPAPIPN